MVTEDTSNSCGHARYRTLVQSPPGKIVAPHGFPADPRPSGAPQIFRDAMDIRIKVFCEEQQCAVEPELDEDDPKSWSWVIYEMPMNSQSDSQHEEHDETAKKPVSTIRLVPPPHPPHPNGTSDSQEEPYVKLTRVATLPQARGRGLSKQLCEEAFKYLQDNPTQIGNGWNGLILTHAQVSVEKMYARMGFVTDSRLGRWEEEGIEHVGMWRKLDIHAKG